MARKRAAAHDDDGGGGDNEVAVTGADLSKYLETVAAAEKRMADRMSAASKKNEPDRKLIKAATKELVESGIESTVLAKIRQKVKLETKAANIASTLTEDQQETFEQFVEALDEFGETPLGKAAIARRRGEDE